MTQSSNPGTIRDWMQQLNEPMGALPMMMAIHMKENTMKEAERFMQNGLSVGQARALALLKVVGQECVESRQAYFHISGTTNLLRIITV